MSGTSTGARLGEQLRYIANEKNAEKWHSDFDSLYNQIIASARSIANEGRYEYRLLDNRLKDELLMSQITRVLQHEKFKVEKGSGTGTPWLLVSWK